MLYLWQMAYRKTRGARVLLHGAFAKERQIYAGGVENKKRLATQIDDGYVGVLDEQVFDHASKKPWLIYPRNKYKTWWDIWILLLMVYTATYFPFLICFHESVGEG